MTEIVRRPSIARNAFTAGSLSVVRGLLGFVTSMIVARSIGPSGQGRFGFVTASVTVLVMVGGMGVSSALIHAKAKLGHSVDQLYGASLVVGGVTAAVLALAFGGSFLVLRHGAFQAIDGGDAIWIGVLVPALLIFSHWNTVAYLDDRIGQFGRAAVVGAALFLLASSVSAGAGQLTVTATVAYWSVSALVPLVIVIRRSATVSLRGISSTARQVFVFGLRTNVATLALILVWRVDVYLVAAKRGVRELGLYTIGVGLSEILLQVGVAFRISLMPLQGSSVERVALRDAIMRVSRVVLVFGAGIAVVVVILARVLVGTLYGAAFLEAGPALAWLVPGVVALLLQGPLVDYLLTEGRIGPVTAVAVGALGIDVAINLALLGDHTFVVASIASTVSYVLSLVAYAWLFSRVADCPLRELARFSRSDLRGLRSSETS